jgi:hypothetical protein
MPPAGLPRNSVSWKVNTTCNYRCSYCLQPDFDEGYPEDISETVACISRTLGQPYEIKIAGGEVVANRKKALELATAIASHGHWLSICTNFWAPLDVYQGIVERMEGRFYHIQASLHLEYQEPEAFLRKCLAMRRSLPKEAKIVVNNVIPNDADKIRWLAEIKSRFESEGLCFYTDLLVDTKGRYQPYTPENRALISGLLGEEERLFESYGMRCRAGHSYFVLLPNLDAWSCWDSYLRNERRFFLGNMRDPDFALRSGPVVCPFDTCSCPTPLIKHRFKLDEAVPASLT